jgi:hypothetical protein
VRVPHFATRSARAVWSLWLMTGRPSVPMAMALCRPTVFDGVVDRDRHVARGAEDVAAVRDAQGAGSAVLVADDRPPFDPDGTRRGAALLGAGGIHGRREGAGGAGDGAQWVTRSAPAMTS